MPNIPQNENYQGTGLPGTGSGNFSIPKIKPWMPNPNPSPNQGGAYRPSTLYESLIAARDQETNPQSSYIPSATPPVIGSPEYNQNLRAKLTEYGLLKGKEGFGTETPFISPQGDFNQPIPIPSDYSGFRQPEKFENFSSGTPKTPVIRNIQGDVPGQYVEDTSDPNLLVKSIRGYTPAEDQAIRSGGQVGWAYQIDHIVPLELGGADTMANRELLSPAQNDLKTIAQSVPYTLYAHGQISLAEARTMAMQWKNRDITDIPEPDKLGLIPDSGGRTGLQIAQDAVNKWKQPKEETFQDKIGKIPQAMKDFGVGWLPDPIREFIKGFGTGATLGFLPYEQGDNESSASWLAGKLGTVAGGVGNFILSGELIDGALALGGMARGALGAWRGATAIAATEAGLTGAEGTAAIAAGAMDTVDALKQASLAETTFKVAQETPGYLTKALTRINSLDKVPGVTKSLITPESLSLAGKIGLTSAVQGVGSQMIAHHLNPYILSGQQPDTEMTNILGNITKDFVTGAAIGFIPGNLRGTLLAGTGTFTLSYLANPDDPTDAIINGLSMGAMHAMGTYQNPDYNNIEMFGGKPIDPTSGPVYQAFNEAANQAAYASLGFYNPTRFADLKIGEIVPDSAKTLENTQAGKDAAIMNIWKRFFLGKDAVPEIQQKVLQDFNNFSQGLNEKLNKLPPLPERPSILHPSARKEWNELIKTQSADITKEFGKGYQARNEYNGSPYPNPEQGMDLNTALTEIKRVTVAARQLYKGGLTAELRNQAHIDDLLSVTKEHLQGRFAAQEKYMHPPIAQQAANEMIKNPAFWTKSYYDDKAQASGQYIGGDIAVTGAAVNHENTALADYYFRQKESGNASPNIILVDRSDTAPLWRMKNKLISESDIKDKKYAIDPKPENALQTFGVVKNPQTGKTELIPLGWVASDFRKDIATGEGHKAFNQHPLVLKYIETNGVEGMRPLTHGKENIAQAMKDQGISVLVANLDPRATRSTKESQQPFIPVNINDQNWIRSIELNKRLNEQENLNPISMDIAKINNARNAEEKSVAIDRMNKNVKRPASQMIPTQPPSKITPQGKIAFPQETTREILQTMEPSLDVASPVELKTAFLNNFGMRLTDEQANNFFAKRNDITVREGIQHLIDAANAGNTNALTKAKLQFAKTYLESGLLQSNDTGKAVPDMTILGKMDNLPAPKITKPLISQEEKTQPTVQPETNIQPTGKQPSVISDATDKISDRLVEKAKEPGIIRQPMSLSGRKPIVPKEGSYVEGGPITTREITPEDTQTNPKPSLSAAQIFAEDGKLKMGSMEVAQDVNTASQQYDAFINKFSNEAGQELFGRGVPLKIINKIKTQIQDDLSNHKNLLLGDEKRPVKFPYKLHKEEIERLEAKNALFENAPSFESSSEIFGTSDNTETVNSLLSLIKKGKNWMYWDNFQAPISAEERPSIYDAQIRNIIKDAEQYLPINSKILKLLENHLSDYKKYLLGQEGGKNLKYPLLDKNGEILKKNIYKLLPSEANRLPEQPQFNADEFYNWIQKGLQERQDTQTYAVANAFNEGFKKLLGRQYQNDTKLRELLKTYFENILSGDTRRQSAKILKERAAGDYESEKTELTLRNEQNQKEAEEKVEDITPISANKPAIIPVKNKPTERGIDANDIKTGFNVKKAEKEGMVYDLTPLEDMIGAIFAPDVTQGNAQAVRSVKGIFLGKSGIPGLRQFILKNHPKAQKTSIPFEMLENTAESVDKSYAAHPEREEQMMEAAKMIVSNLKKKIGVIEEAMATPQEERPAWQTPESEIVSPKILKGYKDLLKKFSDIEAAGKGGPGYSWSESKFPGFYSNIPGSFKFDGKGGSQAGPGPGTYTGLMNSLKYPFRDSIPGIGKQSFGKQGEYPGGIDTGQKSRFTSGSIEKNNSRGERFPGFYSNIPNQFTKDGTGGPGYPGSKVPLWFQNYFQPPQAKIKSIDDLPTGKLTPEQQQDFKNYILQQGTRQNLGSFLQTFHDASSGNKRWMLNSLKDEAAHDAAAGSFGATRRGLEHINTLYNPPLEMTPPSFQIKNTREMQDKFGQPTQPYTLQTAMTKNPDGIGGPGDSILSNVWQTLSAPLQDTQQGSIEDSTANRGATSVPAPQEAPQGQTYTVRGQKITDNDIEESPHVLFSEISNRITPKQRFETRNILNVAINRMAANPGKTLTDILHEPYQFQGYAPNGIKVGRGKTIQSQYQKVKSGNINEADQNKLDVIKSVINELKTGKFDDTTNGAKFYVHARDGSMWLGRTLEEAKKNANQRERQRKIPKTRWGTAIGMPVINNELVSN